MIHNLNKTNTKLLIIETPKNYYKIIIYIYLLFRYKIYIIEPFHAYHHIDVDIRFYPNPLPDYIKKWIIKDKVSLIKADQLNAREIYPRAAHKAVETVEVIYPTYEEQNKEIIKFACSELNSKKVEDIYKKDLSNRLGIFFSMNILIKNLYELEFDQINILLENDILFYKKYLNYVESSGVDAFNDRRIKFCFWSYVISIISRLKRIYILNIKILLQAIASTLFLTIKKNKTKKRYKFGITIIGDRQLRNNGRGADFFIDERDICSSDVVYLPLFSLNLRQKEQMDKLKGDKIIIPSNRRHFSNGKTWFKLLNYFFKITIFNGVNELDIASRAFAEYFKWRSVLKNLSLSNFITHSDFGNNHIARNIALSEQKIKTWYFIDSMNSGNFGDRKKGIGTLHPFWDYLTYEYLISWNDKISKFRLKHHNSIKGVFIVGCLWATKESEIQKNDVNRKIIAAFDTTYTRNSFTSYEEGIEYIKDLIRIVSNNTNIELYFKEKKPNDIKYHSKLDPELGPILLDLYEKMYLHPRIHRFNNFADGNKIINKSDLIISFPFSSTSFEALSANKYAIWHDPLELYRNTEYGQLKDVTTHGFFELEGLIKKLLKNKLSINTNNKTDYFDPYSDFKAIERFRNILVSSEKGLNVK